MLDLFDVLLKNYLWFLLFLLALFCLSNFIFYNLAKLVTKRERALFFMNLVKKVLVSKLGEKGLAIVDIWISGLEKIQDGEFSAEDGVDQFLRYVRLGASRIGIDLDENELNVLQTLILSTLEYFNKAKPKEIQVAVHSFSSMNKV